MCPPQRVKMASTPSAFRALATRWPPLISVITLLLLQGLYAWVLRTAIGPASMAGVLRTANWLYTPPPNWRGELALRSSRAQHRGAALGGALLPAPMQPEPVIRVAPYIGLNNVRERARVLDECAKSKGYRHGVPIA